MSGHPRSLVASHPGNVNAVRHGVYSRSRRVLAPRARAIADELLDAPHVAELDRVAAEEIGSLVALVEAIGHELGERGIASRGAKSLLELRLRASGRLERWLSTFGATPVSRAAFVETLARGSLVDEIRRRRERNGAAEGS